MPQDAFTLRLSALELDKLLAGGKVNKIVQPSRDEVALSIYTGKKVLKLLLNTNAQDCGAYFDTGETEPPATPPGFCMLLRKHLQGAEVLSVALLGFERIMVFTLRSASDFSDADKTLYLDVMGKYSNLILCEQGVILGALKTTALDENAKRMIFPNLPYLPPARQEKADPSDFPALQDVLSKASGDLGDFLFTRVSGLAPSTAHLIAEGYRGGDLAQYVFQYIFSDMVCPCVVERDGIPVDFHARGVEGARPFETLAAAQSYFYMLRRERKATEGRRRSLLQAVNAAIKKNEKRLAQTLEKRKSCENAEELRIAGELITANLHLLTRGMRGAKLENWYAGGTTEVALDPRLTPSENAQSFFKRYRKAKRTLEMLGPLEAETRAELDYLRSLSAAVSSAQERADFDSCEEEIFAAGLVKTPRPRKKEAQSKPRTYVCEGFTILSGRNNLQNDSLVRSASPNDLWLHARAHHSTHAVVKTGGRQVPPSIKTAAAAVCAQYSDGNGDRIPVDCTLIKYVKKPRGSKAGFVTYSEFETLLGDPALVPPCGQ